MRVALKHSCSDFILYKKNKNKNKNREIAQPGAVLSWDSRLQLPGPGWSSLSQKQVTMYHSEKSKSYRPAPEAAHISRLPSRCWHRRDPNFWWRPVHSTWEDFGETGTNMHFKGSRGFTRWPWVSVFWGASSRTGERVTVIVQLVEFTLSFRLY